ncbi:MAG TPA: type II secretion system protein [Candidatus Sumerlaeota bacterium]|nr:type II secretion system protein [Candidatus Sumerlaeota bacterium]
MPHPLPRVKRSRRAFILLEVLVSLTIMGVALAMVMESFTTSMKGARNASSVTMASVLARDLIEQWELTPPEAGEKTGDFGKDHPEYTYKVRYDKVELDYDDVKPPEEGRLEYLRRISLDVYYQTKSGKAAPKRVLHVETALTSGERFSEQARKFNKIRFDQ